MCNLTYHILDKSRLKTVFKQQWIQKAAKKRGSTLLGFRNQTVFLTLNALDIAGRFSHKTDVTRRAF